MKKTFALIWLPFLLLSSCAHKFVRPIQDPPANAFQTDQAKREKMFRYIQGKLDLRFKSPKFKISGSARIFIGEKGETRLEIVDPLGRTQFIGHLAGRMFMAYWPRQERAYTDDEEGRHYLSRYLGLSITFRELIDLMWGMVPRAYRAEKPTGAWGWDDDRNNFITRIGAAELGLNAEKLAVGSLRWRAGGANGTDITAVWGDYSPYEEAGQSFPLANQLKLDAPRTDTELEVSWNDVEPKTKTDFGHSLAPTVSEKTKTVKLP